MGATESRVVRRFSSSAFLQQPKTDTGGESGESKDVKWGLCYMQGWRSHMEDAHINKTSLPGLEGWSLFAILDGHAGEVVANHSAEHLPGALLYEVLPVRDSLQGIQDGLKRGFLRHDKNMQTNFDVLRDRSGSTCTSVLLSPTHIFFANLGDSRVVLSRSGKVAFGTKDHKPTDPEERDRIRGAGGAVINGRVDGGLAVSRAFGDFEYKMRSDLGAVKQKVTAEPDTTVLRRMPGKDEFLILACDGIWDVMSNIAAVKYVAARLKGGNGNNLEWVAQRLVRRCLELGSKDNMSVIIVLFNKDGSVQQGSYASTHDGEDGDGAHPGAGEPRTPEEIIERLATSVAFNAILSGVNEVSMNTGSSVLSPAQQRERLLSVVDIQGIIAQSTHRLADDEPSNGAAQSTGEKTGDGYISVLSSSGGSQQPSQEELDVIHEHEGGGEEDEGQLEGNAGDQEEQRIGADPLQLPTVHTAV